MIEIISMFDFKRSVSFIPSTDISNLEAARK